MPLRLLLLTALLGGATAAAQPTTPALPPDRVASGTAYHVYTEPGAPTMEIVLVRLGSGGLYRLAVGTTLTEFLALSGGTAPPTETTERTIRTSAVRVLRDAGGTRTVIYEASPEQVIREPGRHPVLADGDIVEVVSTVEERPRRTTFSERLGVVTSITSVVSLIFLIVNSVR